MFLHVRRSLHRKMKIRKIVMSKYLHCVEQRIVILEINWNIWGRLKKDKVFFNKVYLPSSLRLNFPYFVVRVFFSSWFREDNFHMGVLFLAFRKNKSSQSTLPVSFVFQVTLAQNSPYAKVAYFGIPYSVTFTC